MRKNLWLILMAACMGATAVASEYLHKPITNQVDFHLPRVRAEGWIEINNADWVDYRLDINEHGGAVHIHYLNDSSSGWELRSGSKVVIPAHEGVWTFSGNNGRQFHVQVRRGSTSYVMFVPDGDESRAMLGMSIETPNDGSELMMAWQDRDPSGWPENFRPHRDERPHYVNDGSPPPHRYGPPIQEPPHHRYGPPIQLPEPPEVHHYDPFSLIR